VFRFGQRWRGREGPARDSMLWTPRSRLFIH